MYLDSLRKEECTGCEACKQICPKKAITMFEDDEGFRYPSINSSLCISCGLCRKICPHEKPIKDNNSEKYTFGGYNKDEKIRFDSTSGGAFSALVTAFCDTNYVIFGARNNGIDVYHDYIENINQLSLFRKSKYIQSSIGNVFCSVATFLSQGKNVLFSGTPCQIAGLLSFLDFKKIDTNNLLTIEVICESVPSPLYIKKQNESFKKKKNVTINSIDYRYKGKSFFHNGKWDFQIMRIELSNKKTVQKDRWFNPFWSIWLQHLISRPSCYHCPYTQTKRNADITLGDLWGVHLYCPELYGKNKGASLIICNTDKGGNLLTKALKYLKGHTLLFSEALKYQSPLRKNINYNSQRDVCMSDLKSNISFEKFNNKWAKKPSWKLLFQKYIWGNRQKIAFYNITHFYSKK